MPSKVILDLGWLLCFGLSFFLPVAVYLKDFSISVLAISFDFNYIGMSARVSVPFSDFKKNYCGESDADSTLCANIILFRVAGLLYCILAALSALCYLYYILQTFGPRYKWLQFQGAVYLIPMFYALAVVVFFVITIAFTDHPKISLSSEYAMKFGSGAIVMLLAEVFAIVGAGLHMWQGQPVPVLQEPLLPQ